MQTPNKPSLLYKLLAMAGRLGVSAKQALQKSKTAKKDAAVKVAEYERKAKETIKEAKTVAKARRSSAGPAKKAAAKKTSAKPAAAKKARTATAAKKTPVKKVAAKTVSAKKTSARK